MGDLDLNSSSYWQWDQAANLASNNEVGFKITRANNSPTMTLTPDGTVDMKVGFQTYLARNADAIIYGLNDVKLRFADYPSGSDPNGNGENQAVSSVTSSMLLASISVLSLLSVL